MTTPPHDPRAPTAAGRRPSAAKLTVVVLALLVMAVAWRTGMLARLAAPRELARALVAMGAWGYLAFVVAYTVLQPFGVPGTIFVVAAPLLWPWPVAFALSMVGTMGASVVGFSFARFVARDWVSARIPARFRKYDEALERHAFQTVAVLRLVFWMPQALHAFLGASRVGFETHFWASLVGYAPPLFLVSFLGAAMFDASGKLQPTAWPAMGGLLVFSAAVATLARAWQRRLDAR